MKSIFPKKILLIILHLMCFLPCHSMYLAQIFFILSGESSAGNNSTFTDLQSLKDIAQQCTDESDVQHSTIQKFQNEESSGTVKFHQIALLHGTLSYQNSELFSSTFKQTNQIFILSLFIPIYKSCLTPSSSQYHAFSVLVSWLKTIEKFSSADLTLNSVFSSNSPTVSRILGLLASNWESPIKGVSGFVKEAYRVLIALSVAECALKKSDFSIVGLLLEQVMKLSWKVKGKYLVLSAVLNFVDYKKVVIENYHDSYGNYHMKLYLK